MPVKFWRYGRVSTDKQAMSPDVQAARTKLEFEHQIATGQLPADSIDGGFMVDTDTSRSVEFMRRPVGLQLSNLAQPGDRICVAAYDRMIGSPVDCAHTMKWALDSEVHLVLMDLRIDTSTNHGRMICQIIAAVKEHEILELQRRTKEALRFRRDNGRPVGPPPIGYQIKTIITVDGQRIKYYFPWIEERNYCRMIEFLHDELGMSHRAICEKFQKENFCKPRSRTGRPIASDSELSTYLRAHKAGYPLHGGVQWKAPDFAYKFADEPINVLDDCA